MEHILQVELCEVSDQDIPSGNGGINRESYTYGELPRKPIIQELLGKVENSILKNFASTCNNRNSSSGFQMFKVNGEYCFWGLRVGPVVRTPNLEEMRKILATQPKTAKAVANKKVSADTIREVTYDLLRKEVAKTCGISIKEAALAIGNQLDCAPHEDPSGCIFMVPKWGS